jgi:low affinity Fe/Cu permease
MASTDVDLPSEVDEHVGWFDRFATSAAGFVGRAPFFAACVLLVVLWVPSYLIIRDLDLYQLVINTATTIVTFLLVALLQNTEMRADLSTQHKLNAIAAALADLMDEHELDDDADELKAAVGLEHRETST